MTGGHAQPWDSPRTWAARARAATGLLLAGLALLLLVVAGADLAATTVAENRAAAAVSEALGLDVEVDIGPWPASPRLLGGAGLQVALRTASGAATPDALLQELDVQLTGATPTEDWSGFAADRARWSVTLDPARAPLGLSLLAGSAEAVGLATDEDGAVTLSAAHVTLDDPDDASPADAAAAGDGAALTEGSGGLTAASGHDLTLRLDAGGGPAALTAARAGVELARGAQEAPLPLGARQARLDMDQLELTVGGAAPTRLRAHSAALVAHGVPVLAEGEGADPSGARLDEVVGHLPMLAIDHPGGAQEVVVASEGATFTTALDDGDLTQLWDGPGTIVVADRALQLVLGPLVIDVDVRPEGRLLMLTPVLPQALEQLFGEVSPVVVTPSLPEGLTLSAVEVVGGSLRVRGGGDQITVPVG